MGLLYPFSLVDLEAVSTRNPQYQEIWSMGLKEVSSGGETIWPSILDTGNDIVLKCLYFPRIGRHMVSKHFHEQSQIGPEPVTNVQHI